MAAEYCPECASVMGIAGRYKNGNPYLKCPSCHYTTYTETGTTPDKFMFGKDFPPGSVERCPRCGAYTFGYPFTDRPTCRRCGTANPKIKGQAEPARFQQPQSGTQFQQPQQGYPTPGFATPTEQPRQGFWNTVFGVFTIMVAVSLLFTIFGMYIHSPAKTFIVTFWVIHDGIGILGGFLSISGGKFGKLLRKIFWIMLPILIVLALLLGL